MNPKTDRALVFVEENQLLRAQLEEQLSAKGFQVYAFETSNQALDWVTQHSTEGQMPKVWLAPSSSTETSGDGQFIPCLLVDTLPESTRQNEEEPTVFHWELASAYSGIRQEQTSPDDALPVGIFRTDAEGRWTEANRTALQILGLTQAELQERGWLAGLHPPQRDAISHHWQAQTAQCLSFEVEVRLISGSEHQRWASLRVNPQFTADGVFEGYCGSLTEISDLKNQELQLRKQKSNLEQERNQYRQELARTQEELQQANEARQVSESRFRLLSNKAQDVVFRLRFQPEPAVEYVSPAIETLAGFSPETFYRDTLMALRLVYPHDRIRVVQLLRHPEGFQTPLEIRWRTRSGETIWVEQRTAGIFDDEGNLVALEGIARNITERKQAEADLKAERRFLKQLIDMHERDRQLVAYEIHDGLVQHLTGALMHLEVFARQQKPESGKAQEEYNRVLELLRSTIAEARSLISGLRPPILDEAGIVSAIDYLVHETREQSGIAIEYYFEVDFEELPPPLENALFRIAQEGLTNMARHSKTRAALVELVQLEEHVRLTIQDWGVGFDPKSVQPRRYGLQGIRERARLFGGSASLQSSPGEGTKITVDLPMVLSASSVP